MLFLAISHLPEWTNFEKKLMLTYSHKFWSTKVRGTEWKIFGWLIFKLRYFVHKSIIWSELDFRGNIRAYWMIIRLYFVIISIYIGEKTQFSAALILFFSFDLFTQRLRGKKANVILHLYSYQSVTNSQVTIELLNKSFKKRPQVPGDLSIWQR